MGNYRRSELDYHKNGYLGINVEEPQELIHVYGLSNTLDENGLMHNNLMVDGVSNGDKGLVFADDGNRKWKYFLKRNENGEYKYLYNYKLDKNIMTFTEGGRVGVNAVSNYMNPHSQYINTETGALDDLVVGGIYNKKITRYYEIIISDISTSPPDKFKWKVSTDYGQTWSSYSSDINCVGPNSGDVEIENGITVHWKDINGHNLNDVWRFWAYSPLPSSSLSVSSQMFEQVQITYDYTYEPVEYVDKTYNCGSIYPPGFILMSGNTSLVYIGRRTNTNSIYVAIDEPSSGLTLQVDYLGESGWTTLNWNTNNYLDGTNNLTTSGTISWDNSSMSDWQPSICTGFTDILYWLRLTSTTPIVTGPSVFLMSPHGNRRFGVRSGQIFGC
jgi:hypothetical protein